MQSRSLVLLIGIAVLLIATATLAGVDVSDIDTYLMQDMEDAIKDLEPVLGAGNAESAVADAEVLRDGLKWAEDYFAAKGSAEDAVQIARDGQQLVAGIFDHLQQKNFSAAIEAARATSQNCKRCHDLYERQR